MKNKREILILAKSDVEQLIDSKHLVLAIEKGFIAMAEGSVVMPPIQTARSEKLKGELEVKSAIIESIKRAASKVVTWYPDNQKKRGLPSILGLVVLFDAVDGQPLAIMDGAAFTGARTGAAGAIGARYLARRDSSKVAVIGAGAQGRWQLSTLCNFFEISEVRVFDIDSKQANRYAESMASKLGFPIQAVNTAKAAVDDADIVVTATASRSPILQNGWIKPGMHINAIGADAPGKQELELEIIKRAYLVVDVWQQCREMGEAQHAYKAGILSDENPPPEMGQVILGRRAGRRSPEDITVFDSTGTGMQDVVAADLIYRNALEAEAGRWVSI